MKVFFVLLLIVKSSLCFIDPITAVGLAGLAYFGYNFDSIKKATYCKVNECCIKEHIPANIFELENLLKDNLYGQHIVIQQLIPALTTHYHGKRNSNKPLVISFHGTPGTGKNYVADFIAKSIYKEGLQSKYVHKFLGRADFPLESHSNIYSADLVSKVRRAIFDCPQSLFIFDEVDKMPPGVFEALTSLLDHHSHLYGTDFSKATFIFLSNTAGSEISKLLANLMKEKGVWREQTKLSDFEKLLEVAAYNVNGGLKKASIIESHLIDHFIPFLPLEKEHVKKCLEKEYQRSGLWNVKEDRINDMIDNYVTFDSHSGLFSTTGCKRLNKKVEIDIHKRHY